MVSVLNWFPLFGRPGIDAATLSFSVTALVPLGLAVFPVSLSNLLIRTFYVRRRIWPPVIISALLTSLNALLYSVLAPRYGIVGLSWGTVVAGWVQLGVLLYLVGKREPLEFKSLASQISRVWLAALLAVGLGWLLVTALPLPGGWWGAVFTVTIGGSLSALLYLAFCYSLWYKRGGAVSP